MALGKSGDGMKAPIAVELKQGTWIICIIGWILCSNE